MEFSAADSRVRQERYRERRRTPDERGARQVGVSVQVLRKSARLQQVRPELFEAIVARAKSQGLTLPEALRGVAAAASRAGSVELHAPAAAVSTTTTLVTAP
jgi:hypothetical protein